MKLAVLADIHANFVALQTVAAHIESWQPDVVVVAGDIVNRGPRPLDCLRFVQSKQQTEAWLTVRGNHEDYVLRYTRPDTVYNELEFEIYRSAYWTYCQLDGQIAALDAMPFQVDLAAPSGAGIRVVHASMRGNRDGIFPETTDNELRQKIRLPDQPPPPLLCVGHTHRPLIRYLDRTLVINVGAVGLPFDGDLRACYGQLTWQHGWWQAEIIRLDYDRQEAERDFFDTGFLEESGPLSRLILNEFHTAQSRLYQWAEKYHARVLANELTLEDSTQKFLEVL